MADLVIGFDSRKAPADAQVWIQAANQTKKAAEALERAADKVGESFRRTGKEQKTAAQKAEEYTRSQRLVAQIMRDTGASHTTAAKAVRLFRGDLDKAEKEALQYARAIDAADKEVRELTVSQRQGGGIAKAFGAELQGMALRYVSIGAAIAGVYSVIRAGIGQIGAAKADFIALENAVRDLTKVTDGLSDSMRQQLIGRLEDLSTSTIPIATEKLIELGATAAQMGIETAAGMEAAAAAGAKLEQATDLSGEAAVKALTRLISVEGEVITSIGNVGSALVALGNTSRLTEAEIVPVASEIGRANANFGLGTTTILGYATALAEMGAKAEGSGSALNELFQALHVAARTGAGLEDLAKVAGVTASELKKLAADDIGGAALMFLKGLDRFGKDGLIALDEVGLASKRTAKALLPLAANWERLESRLKLANDAHRENIALDKEAAAAFATLEAQLQRAENALKLVRSRGFEPLAKVLGSVLDVAVDAMIQWRAMLDVMSESPLTSGWLEAFIEDVARLLEGLAQVPRGIAVVLFQLANLAAKMLEIQASMARFTPGVNARQLRQDALVFRAMAEEIEKVAKAGIEIGKIKKPFGEAGDASGKLRKQLDGLLESLLGVGEGADKTAKKTKSAAEQYAEAILALRETVSITQLFSTSSEIATEAQKLLADGVANTVEEAIALAREAALLRKQLELLSDASEVRIKITAEVETIDQDLPEYARQTLEPVPIIEQMKVLKETAVEQTQDIVDATSDMLYQLADAASRFDSDWAQMLSSVGRLVDAIGQLGNLGGGAGGGGGQGNAAASAAQAMSAVSTVIAVFTAIYDIYDQIQSDRKGKRFGDTVAIGGNNTSGIFRLGGEETFASTQGVDALGPQAWRALRQSIDEWRIAMGSILTYMPELNIAIREDGEKVRLEIAGQFIAFFASAGEAAQAGIEIALQQSTFENMGDAMRTALDNIQRIGAEAFLELIPVLRLVDDAAAGLTATQSAAKLVADQWAVSLDVMTERLIDLGLTGEQVVAFRDREIAKMVEQTRQAGLNLAGINLGLDALTQWQAGVDAVNDAAQRSAASNQAYADAADAVDVAIGGGGGATGGEGGLIGGMNRVEGGLISVGEEGQNLRESLEDLVSGSGGLIRTKNAVDAFGGTVAELPDQVSTAAAQIEQWFKDTVSAIFSLTTTSGAFQQILDFQERYGVELVNSEALRRQIAEMEFMAAKLRIQLLAMELIANQELLGLTAAQIAMIQAAAEAIIDIEFPGMPREGGGSRGASRRTAADNFRAEVERMELALSGATDGAIAYAQASDRLREQHRQGKLAAEELTYALSLLAEIQLGEIADDWRTASERLGQTDVEAAASALQRRASEALADALAAAADNPAAYEAARLAIEQGLEDQMRQIGFDALAGLGSPLLALQRAGRDTIREIEFLVSHLEELGLTAGQVAGVVRQSIVPSLLEMAAAEAERVGDLERAERLRARQAEIERALMIIQVRLWEAQLIAAGAMTDALQTIIDNLLVDLATTADEAARSLDAFRAALAGIAGLKDPNKTPGAPDDEEPTLPIWMTKPPPAPDVRGQGGGGTGGEDEGEEAGELLADIIEELRRNAEGPMERLASAHEDMLERIANATGTAAERLEAIALAEEEYARLRQQVLEDAWAGVKALIEDQMATGVLGGSPEERRQALTREVYSLAAQAAAGDLDAAQRLGERGGELLRLIEDLYGGSAAGAGLTAPIIQLLQQAMMQAGLADPLGGLGQNVIPPGPGPTTGAGGAGSQQAQVVADLAAVVTALHDEAAASRAQHSSLVQAHIRADTHNTNEMLGALYSLAPDARNVAPGAQGV